MTEKRHTLRERFIRNGRVCSKCHGEGLYLYPSGSTWRGGVGSCSYTVDVCDECWGSGRRNLKFTDIRKLEQKRRDWEEAQCVAWLARKLCADLRHVRPYIALLSELAEKQSRKRKVPDGYDLSHWYHTWHMLSVQLKKLTCRV